MDTITLDQATALIGISPAADWNGRRYYNVAGAASKLYWTAGKIHFQAGRGNNSTEANTVFARVLGCNVIDRYTKAAAYVVVEG